MKKYLAVWGSWDKGAHSYDPFYKEVYLTEITEDEGYSDNDFFIIQHMERGEKWESKLGNHLIIAL